MTVARVGGTGTNARTETRRGKGRALSACRRRERAGPFAGTGPPCGSRRRPVMSNAGKRQLRRSRRVAVPPRAVTGPYLFPHVMDAAGHGSVGPFARIV